MAQGRYCAWNLFTPVRTPSSTTGPLRGRNLIAQEDPNNQTMFLFLLMRSLCLFFFLLLLLGFKKTSLGFFEKIRVKQKWIWGSPRLRTASGSTFWMTTAAQCSTLGKFAAAGEAPFWMRQLFNRWNMLELICQFSEIFWVEDLRQSLCYWWFFLNMFNWNDNGTCFSAFDNSLGVCTVSVARLRGDKDSGDGAFSTRTNPKFGFKVLRKQHDDDHGGHNFYSRCLYLNLFMIFGDILCT